MYMSASLPEKKKPLGVRATIEQHRVLAEAAKREHRSLSNFVLQAALKAAEGPVLPSPRYTEEEANAMVREAQAMFRQSNAVGRDLVEELLAERRAEASRE